MDEIVPVDFPLNRSALTVNLTCGDCRHHGGIPAPGQKSCCAVLGVIQEQTPCLHFSVSPFVIDFGSDMYLRMISRIIRKLNRKKLNAVASLLLQEARTRRYGFNMGDVVYFKAYGDDFLSNYRKGYVVSADKHYVVISGRRGREFSCYISAPYVLRKAQWLEKQKELIAANRLVDPRYPATISPKKAVVYEPPTIDQAPSEKPRKTKRI